MKDANNTHEKELREKVRVAQLEKEREFSEKILAKDKEYATASQAQATKQKDFEASISKLDQQLKAKEKELVSLKAKSSAPAKSKGTELSELEVKAENNEKALKQEIEDLKRRFADKERELSAQVAQKEVEKSNLLQSQVQKENEWSSSVKQAYSRIESLESTLREKDEAAAKQAEETQKQALEFKDTRKKLRRLNKEVDKTQKIQELSNIEITNLKRQLEEAKNAASAAAADSVSLEKYQALEMQLQEERAANLEMSQKIQEYVAKFERQVEAKDDVYKAANVGDYSELDTELLQGLEECVNQLADSTKKITIDEVGKLKSVFKTEVGRRHFVKVLRRIIKKSSGVVCSKESFEVLLYLFNLCIHEMENSPSRDFISAKKIMKASMKISNEENRYMKDYIKEHAIWLDIYFWQEYFLEELLRKQRQYLSGDVDIDFLSTMCSSFILAMQQWGIAMSSIRDFMTNMLSSEAAGLKEQDSKEVLAALNEFMQYRENPRLTRKKNTAGSSIEDIKRSRENTSKSQIKFTVPDEGNIVKQGYLLKKGDSRRNWSLRWFILKTKHLVYMKSPKDVTPLDVIFLDRCTVGATSIKPFCFVVSSVAKEEKGVTREFFIRGKDEKEKQEWMTAIYLCVQDILNPSLKRSPSLTSSPAQTRKNDAETKSPLSLRGQSALRSSSSGNIRENNSQIKDAKKPDASGTTVEKPFVPNAIGVAIDDFEGAEENQLSFKEGEMLKVETQDNVGWWRGELDSKVGWIPKDRIVIMNVSGTVKAGKKSKRASVIGIKLRGSESMDDDD
eukprot:TRINITY_DN2153_c0_g1_i2.p1 TRINITY_DN2153_c0_g1~~TRINITY_DN2153_c0_g1_i2.p1  ORF type:complete len:793 (-),score=309.66 TRINITY_DN2153_c0_g1_i2:84-2462(-)